MVKLLTHLALFLISVVAQDTFGEAESIEITGNTEIYVGLVLGIGRGTLAIIIFVIIGIIICFFKDVSPTPMIIVTIGVALPILVLLIILMIPLEAVGDEV